MQPVVARGPSHCFPQGAGLTEMWRSHSSLSDIRDTDGESDRPSFLHTDGAILRLFKRLGKKRRAMGLVVFCGSVDRLVSSVSGVDAEFRKPRMGRCLFACGRPFSLCRPLVDCTNEPFLLANMAAGISLCKPDNRPAYSCTAGLATRHNPVPPRVLEHPGTRCHANRDSHRPQGRKHPKRIKYPVFPPDCARSKPKRPQMSPC